MQFEGEPVGVAFAFANAALFTAYIVLAHRVARRPAIGRDRRPRRGNAARLPVRLADRALERRRAFSDPVAIAAGIGVGVTSSVIPYVFDQLAMARLARATYALFVALLPATATVIGVIVLQQLPSRRPRRHRARDGRIVLHRSEGGAT